VEPRLSVAIPTRNTRDLTLAALASLYRQSVRPDEIVVVDDGSDDGSQAAIAKRFPNVCQIRNTGAVGFAGALNTGVAATTGDLVWLLNSDTEVDPDGVERVASHFNGDSTLGIAGANLRYPDGSPQWSGGRFPTPLWLILQASDLPALLGRRPAWRRIKPVSGTRNPGVGWVSGASMIIRREVWGQAGPMSGAYLQYCQDLDLCWRARSLGWKVRVLPDVGVVHHHGATIALDPQVVGVTHTAHLWSDLVRFFDANHGRRVAVRAARLIRLGGWVRISMRRMIAPIVARSDRAAWRADTERHLRTLREFSKDRIGAP